MRSLKAILPDIGAIIGMTHHTLYVRQQALTREGLFPVLPGRGPGSGVPASAETVATLLIGLLAAIDPADVAHNAREFCSAVSASGGASHACPLSGKHNFKDALVAILADQRLADRADEILVAPSHGQAFVRYDRPPFENGPELFAAGEYKSSVFVAPHFVRTPLSVSVTVYSDVIRAIAALVRSVESDQ